MKLGKNGNWHPGNRKRVQINYNTFLLNFLTADYINKKYAFSFKRQENRGAED